MEWKQSIHWWIIRHCQSFSRVENLEAGVVTHEKSPLPFPVHGRAACPDQSPPSLLGLSHTIYEALGHQPINSPGNSLQGLQRCKSPPLSTYTLTQLSPTGAGHQRGWCYEWEGPEGPAGKERTLGMVGVGGRGMTQEAEPFSCAPIRQISSVLIASWPSGALLAVSLGTGVGEGACFMHMGSWEASALFQGLWDIVLPTPCCQHLVQRLNNTKIIDGCRSHQPGWDTRSQHNLEPEELEIPGWGTCT